MESDGEMMRFKKFKASKQAVAGVIEALLIVALVSIILSMIQLVYIPQIMNQREADHMDVVSNQFSSLKSYIDLQAMTQSDSPIFSMITLSSEELPYFITASANGAISAEEDDEWNINIDYGAYVYDLTSIKYEAYNSYFVDQTYILEGGGIIVEQPNEGSTMESVMRVDPSISVENRTDLDIYFDLPIIVGFPGKNYTHSSGTISKCFVRTNYSQGDTDTITNVVSVNISTQYPNAWYESLYSIFGENVNYEQGSRYVEITKKDKDINLYIDYYYIHTQIGIGWIK